MTMAIMLLLDHFSVLIFSFGFCSFRSVILAANKYTRCDKLSKFVLKLIKCNTIQNIFISINLDKMQGQIIYIYVI